MKPSDLYKLLGVGHQATPEQIKSAYRVAARRFHPDTNRDPGASEEFRMVADAYAILNDPKQRAQYDKARVSGTGVLLGLQLHHSRPALLATAEQQVLYVLAEVRPAFTGELPDPPVNLCVVIDRSTSMQGARLDQVKTSVLQIIDNLRPGDVLSVVAFGDRAEVILSPQKGAMDKAFAKAKVSTLNAGGGTEIYQGLLGGLIELHKSFSPASVNHLMLLTDGQTYGDESNCLLLATLAASDGISVSGLGIGEEWNDKFLDGLTGRAGGVAVYIKSPDQVNTFMRDRVRGLGAAFGERLQLRVTLDTGIILDSVFKVRPEPAPVSVEQQPFYLGNLPKNDQVSVLLKFVLPPLEADKAEGLQSLARLTFSADVISLGRRGDASLADVILPVTQDLASTGTPPPNAVVEALGKLSQYKMQERAWQKASEGDVEGATKILQTLGTRLLASGQTGLAKETLAEAKRLENTRVVSEEAQKQIKYGTRALISPGKGSSALPKANSSV